jgi:hypothetical protein
MQLDLLIIQRYLEGVTRLQKGNPKGDMNKDDAMYGSKSFKPKKKKELKFMPLAIISQHRFDWEQYLKSFPHAIMCTRWLQCAPYQFSVF